MMMVVVGGGGPELSESCRVQSIAIHCNVPQSRCRGVLEFSDGSAHSKHAAAVGGGVASSHLYIIIYIYSDVAAQDVASFMLGS